MSHITIGFSTARATLPFSEAVKTIEKRPYSHVFVILNEPYFGRKIVYHAAHGIVHSLALSSFLQHNSIVKRYLIPVNSSQLDNIQDFLYKALGTPYGISQILYIFLLKLKRQKKPALINGRRAQICSELGAEVAKLCGVSGLPQNLDSITPSDLDKVLEANNIACL